MCVKRNAMRIVKLATSSHFHVAILFSSLMMYPIKTRSMVLFVRRIHDSMHFLMRAIVFFFFYNIIS